MVTLPGHVMEGDCVSLTITVKEQVAILPAESVIWQFTVVTPFANMEPEAGEQVGGVRSTQSSLTAGGG
jgi:hypothetical protein